VSRGVESQHVVSRGIDGTQTTIMQSQMPAYQREMTVTEGNKYTVTGEERVLSTRQFVDETRTSVIGERVVEHSVKVPKRIIVEEIIEKVVIIPEKRIREEVREDVELIKEKIIEVQKPVIHEKIIEVPEIEYVEKIVEVVEVVAQEKIKEVAKIEYQERVVEIPRIEQREKIVEVPQVEYRDIPVERVEEVPEIREQVVIKEIPVPQYVEKPIMEYVTVEEPVDVQRAVPVPVEAIVTYEFTLPRINPVWRQVDVPLYVPRFVEVPVPVEMMHDRAIEEANVYSKQVAMLGMQQSTSLCEIETLAKSKPIDFKAMMKTDDVTSVVIKALQSGLLEVSGVFNHAIKPTAQSGFVASSPGRVGNKVALTYSHPAANAIDVKPSVMVPTSTYTPTTYPMYSQVSNPKLSANLPTKTHKHRKGRKVRSGRK